MTVTRVPNSLGAYRQTSAPLYLALAYVKSQNLEGGRWRGVNGFVSDGIFILPPPKSGLGTSTQQSVMDDVSIWSAVLSTSDRIRQVTSDSAAYGIGEMGNYLPFIDSPDFDYPRGGVTVPPDKTGLRYGGIRKRVWNFSFQLFAYTEDDAKSIKDFADTMHKLCLPGVKPGEGGQKSLTVPAMFYPRIVDHTMSQEAYGWIIEPQPCTMLAFSTSAGQYASVSNGQPGVLSVNMVLGEIEPIVVEGNTIKITTDVFPPGEGDEIEFN